jgi:hypothetical protein
MPPDLGVPLASGQHKDILGPPEHDRVRLERVGARWREGHPEPVVNARDIRRGIERTRAPVEARNQPRHVVLPGEGIDRGQVVLTVAQT